MTITLTVSGRIASVDATAHVVAGNTYPVALSLDSEWTGSLYLRVRFGSLYYDIPFASSDASVDVQMPVGYPEVGIGVFSEALEICSCEARIRLLRSILETGEQVVEFDSDLYDQWAGEVSELLCDDAFDAESDRPVKNSVLTAWKDTVPLDANLVHKTGAETIAGAKTFTSRPEVNFGNPILALIDPRSYSGSSNKGGVEFYGQYSTGTVGRLGGIGIWQSVSGSASRQSFLMRAQDQGGTAEVAISKFLDGHSEFTAPSHLPVDGSSNPLAPGNNEVMTSAMLAVDPRIVHTTGAESIAGDKTLSGTFSLARADPTVNFKSSTTTAQTGVKANIVFYTSNTVRGQVFQQRDASTEFIALRQQKLVGSGFSELKLRVDSNDVGWAECPSYTADQSADTKIVTRAMLATTPTVVHTTGTETIAGNKTFTGTTNFDARLSIKNAIIANDTHWFRLYEIAPHSNSGNVEFIVRKRTGASLPARFQLYCGGAGSSTLSFQVETNPPLVQCVAARRSSDNHVEIWGRCIWSDWQIPFYYRHGMVVSDYQTADEPPAVGDTYDLIATI